MKSAIPQLSSTEGLILELLAGTDRFGLELVQQSGGRLKRGTVYVTLGRMEAKGYLESWTEPLPAGAIGLPRRRYRPTSFGFRMLDASTAAALAFANRLAKGS
jgi:PadR family transcriptional regulator, regulatory protein PadR